MSPNTGACVQRLLQAWRKCPGPTQEDSVPGGLMSVTPWHGPGVTKRDGKGDLEDPDRTQGGAHGSLTRGGPRSPG